MRGYAVFFRQRGSTVVEGKTFDVYNDYFDTRYETDEWADNARKA